MSDKEIWVLTESYSSFGGTEESFTYFLGKPSLSQVSEDIGYSLDYSKILLENGSFYPNSSNTVFHLEKVEHKEGLGNE